MDTPLYEIGSIQIEIGWEIDGGETFEGCANVIGKVQAKAVNTGKVLGTSEDNETVQETSENVPIGSKNCFLR